jgi:CubicO group peptidase (beta-lactamase class C family)
VTAHPSPRPLDPSLAARVDQLVAQAQSRWHSPNVSVGIVRDGALTHSAHVGAARLDPRVPATDDTPFMIGSVTKTLTAVLVMSLRDEGRLDLDDALDRFLPGRAHGEVTVRLLLSHLSGLQREPVGRMWESLVAPDTGDLLGQLDQAERVLAPGLAFHYSNLAYALLGQVVEVVTAAPWERVVAERILTPLSMSRTGLIPPADRALGYFVDEFSGVATQEPTFDLGATAPLGGLWSTVADLGRYAAFLAEPDPAVLAPATVEQMCRPVAMVDPDTWTYGYGLGWSMTRRGERVYTGHGGAMPGYLTAVQVSRPDRLGVVAWVNSSAGCAPMALAGEVLDLVLDAEPTLPPAWVPEEPAPGLTELLGFWWSEGTRLAFFVREGRLWCRVDGDGLAVSETRFEPEGPDLFRAVQGRERGERLELTRDRAGHVTRMHFATYAVTRDPRSFADLGS